MDRVPAVSLLMGSLCGLLLSVVIIAMDIAHVFGDTEMMLGLGVLYEPLFLLTFIFLCFGLASLPAIRRVRARTRAEATRSLVAAVAPIWERANGVHPSISRHDVGAFTTDNAEARLHRQVVEIRDAVFDPRVAFSLSESERELVDRAEAHLTGRPLNTRADSRRMLGRPKEAQ